MTSNLARDFPFGKPFPLILIEIVFPICFIISAVVFGLIGWRSAVPTFAIVVAYGVAYSLVIRHYEQTVHAVPRRKLRVIVRFPGGFPKLLFAARSAFFLVVALMLVFGFGPFGFTLATKGIIGCVIALVAVAVLNLLLERHYVQSGRGIEVELITTKPNDP